MIYKLNAECEETEDDLESLCEKAQLKASGVLHGPPVDAQVLGSGLLAFHRIAAYFKPEICKI